MEEWDLMRGAQYDFRCPAAVGRLRRRIMALAKEGRLVGIHFGPPCTSWSIARHPALRSRSKLWGESFLNAKDAQQVREANLVMRQTMLLIDTFSAFVRQSRNAYVSFPAQLPL